MTPETNIDLLIEDAQKGSREARDKIIKKFTPFIIRTVSKICGKYVRMGEDDEVSIGLMAFDEAVLSYCGKTSKNFMSYCELVIKHRLIDYFRKVNRNKTISLEEVSEGSLPAEDDISKLIYNQGLREEIIMLSSELKEYGITFKDLVECSPKHKETRETVVFTALNIAANASMIQIIKRKKYLPQKEITLHFNVTIKHLERFRKYIIATCLIFSGNYTGLQNFIRGGVGHGFSTKASSMRIGS